MTRHILSFPIDGQRFNYRVAAIIIVDGHVLVCDENDDGYSMLPGGRVEIGEPSDVALAREIVEELLTGTSEDAVEVAGGVPPFTRGAELLGSSLEVCGGLRDIRVDARI